MGEIEDDREENIADLSRSRTRAGRETRVDHLEEERLERARDLAFAEGRRRAQVDGELASHKARLDVINGSIERHAKAIERMSDELAARNAVEVDRVKQLKTANDNSLSSRMFFSGVAGVMVMMLGVIISLLVAVHVL